MHRSFLSLSPAASMADERKEASSARDLLARSSSKMHNGQVRKDLFAMEPSRPGQITERPARYWEICAGLLSTVPRSDHYQGPKLSLAGLEIPLYIAQTTIPLKSFGVSPCSTLICNTLHTGSTLILANGSACRANTIWTSRPVFV